VAKNLHLRSHRYIAYLIGQQASAVAASLSATARGSFPYALGMILDDYSLIA
jgi:hypothetical protein